MAEDASPSPTLSPTLRLEIERWFVRRGVPQLIDGYSTEAAMDARAAPFISVWLILGTILYWGTRPDWPLANNVGGVAATVAWMAAVWTMVSRIRGRPFGKRPPTFDVIDILTIALLPALPAGLIDGSTEEAFTAFFGALAGMGVIYIVIGFGVFEIAAWALTRLGLQIVHIVGLVARTLPLLLILVVFLLFSSEIWVVARALTPAEVGMVLVLLMLVGELLVVTTFKAEVRRLERSTDSLSDDLAGTPAAPLDPGRQTTAPRAFRLSWLQRTNLTLLVAIQQLVQSAIVVVIVMASLVIFGLLAIPSTVQESWIAAPVSILAQFELLDEARTLSGELLTVSALLGGVVGLYFTGLAITDPAYRAEQFDRTIAEVRQLLAVRTAYLSALREPVAAR